MVQGRERLFRRPEGSYRGGLRQEVSLLVADPPPYPRNALIVGVTFGIPAACTAADSLPLRPSTLRQALRYTGHLMPNVSAGSEAHPDEHRTCLVDRTLRG